MEVYLHSVIRLYVIVHNKALEQHYLYNIVSYLINYLT
jgi:hypothetical protein